MRLGLFERVRRFARLHGRIRGRSGRPSGPAGSTGPAGYANHVGSGYPGGSAYTPDRGSQGDPAHIDDDRVSASDRASTADPRPAGARPAGDAGAEGAQAEAAGPSPLDPWAKAGGAGRHRRDGEQGSGTARAVRAGSARARIREEPAPDQAGAQQATMGQPGSGRAAVGRAAARSVAKVRSSAEARQGSVRAAATSARASMRAKLPFTAPRVRERDAAADGRRNCGSLERVIWRQWDAAALPPPEVVAAIDRLAELPERIKTRLADGLDSIFVGPGGVPELDEMTSLRGVRLPSGHASWDVCAGAYGERKIVVGSRPSPTPDVMCHEIGHALDDIDSPPGTWQSDSAEFRILYDQCQPHFASDFHRQPGGLGRKEFFADAFAAIASGQRPALVDMLRGETRTALRVMLYFNRRYDI
jgi:hypothetical protein